MNMWKNLSKTARILILSVCGLFLLTMIIGLLVILAVYRFENPVAFAGGLALGSLLSVVKVVLMEKGNSRLVEMQGKDAKNMGSLYFVLRFAVTLAALVFVVLLPQWFGVIGAVVGILNLQIGAYITGNIMRRTSVE